MSLGSVDEWTDIAKQQEKGVTEAGQDGCLATFYHCPVYNARKSENEGRPVYDAVPFVKIIVPGDNKSVVDRKVQDADKKRWPTAWKRFEDREEGVLTGTPLEEWAYLNATRIAELKHLGMRTVEQVAHLSDDMLGQIGPGARDLRTRAQQFLKPQSEVETALRGEVADLKQTVASQSAQLDEALRQIEDLTAPKTVKRRAKAADTEE